MTFRLQVFCAAAAVGLAVLAVVALRWMLSRGRSRGPAPQLRSPDTEWRPYANRPYRSRGRERGRQDEEASEYTVMQYALRIRPQVAVRVSSQEQVDLIAPEMTYLQVEELCEITDEEIEKNYIEKNLARSEEEEESLAIHKGMEDTCVICLDDLESGVLVRTLPCRHTFHSTCITPWLIKTRKCPVCVQSFQQQLYEAETLLQV